jgi:hypothetical protein
MAAGDIILRDPGAALGDIKLSAGGGATTPNIFVNVAGVSKRAVAVYVNVGGVAKLMTNLSINVAGVKKDVVFS